MFAYLFSNNGSKAGNITGAARQPRPVSSPGVAQQLQKRLGGRPLGELLVGAGAGGGVLRHRDLDTHLLREIVNKLNKIKLLSEKAKR